MCRGSQTLGRFARELGSAGLYTDMAKRLWIAPRHDEGMTPLGSGLRAPYGLEIIENCLACPHREDRLFCNLPAAVLQRLAEITSPASYPKGATLFVEGQEPRGVFIICSGGVKLSTSSSDGRTLILRIADAGEVLGLRQPSPVNRTRPARNWSKPRR